MSQDSHTEATNACLPDGAAIRRMRRQLTLTQEQVAKCVGYSIRVIRKAERGRTIAAETAKDIQTFFDEALPAASVPILLPGHVETVRKIMESYHEIGSEMVNSLRHLFHPRFVWRSVGDPTEFPFAGEFHGAGAFQEWLARFEQTYVRDPDSFQIEYFTAGDSVLAAYSESYHVGDEVLPNLKTFVQFAFRDGKVVSMEDNYDTSRNLAFWKQVSEAE